MKHFLILIALALPMIATAKSIDIVPNTFSAEQYRAVAPFVVVIDGQHEIRNSRDLFALGICYQHGSEAVRSAISLMLEPDAADATPIDQQLFSIASSLANDQRAHPEKFSFITTHLSALSPAVKSALEACLN